MIPALRQLVFRIVARHSGREYSSLRGYFLLRRTQSAIPDLGMGDSALTGMVPDLNAIVVGFNQRISPAEVLDADSVKNISDVVDLVEAKLDAALEDAKGQVLNILAAAAQPKRIPADQIEQTALLAAPPLSLTTAGLHQVVAQINLHVPRWQPKVNLTPGEMAPVASIKQLLDLVAAEIIQPIGA